MIKILFFIESLDGGGAEKVLRNLVNNMDQNCFDITVQTVWPCDYKKYLSVGIHYRSMYSSSNWFTRILYRLEAGSRMAYISRIQGGYDIECAYLECGSTKILSASTNKKAFKVAWVHCDLMKLMADPYAFADKTKKYYTKYNRVVCVSDLGKESFENLYGTIPESEIVHNVIDCDEILTKSKTISDIPKQHGMLRVVSVGRLSKPKHYIRLLKAHERLIKDGIKHDLLIIGEGPDRPLLESFVREYNLESTVSLPGFKDNPYVYMKDADVLACSSIYECFSTFITEGLILGRPIVTTDVSGMRELLGNSEFGLITANDDDSFYLGLRRMLIDSSLRCEYSKLAEKRGKNFTTYRLTKENEAFLKKCVSNGRK